MSGQVGSLRKFWLHGSLARLRFVPMRTNTEERSLCPEHPVIVKDCSFWYVRVGPLLDTALTYRVAKKRANDMAKMLLVGGTK